MGMSETSFEEYYKKLFGAKPPAQVLGSPMFPRARVYLAGDISGQTYEGAVGWRQEVALALSPGIAAISPMRAKGELKEPFADAPLGSFEDYKELVNCDPRSICTRDRFDCTRADMILMNLLNPDKTSIGSMIELGWADAACVPVVLCTPNGSTERYLHPMIEGLVGWWVTDLDKAVLIINQVLGPYVGMGVGHE